MLLSGRGIGVERLRDETAKLPRWQWNGEAVSIHGNQAVVHERLKQGQFVCTDLRSAKGAKIGRERAHDLLNQRAAAAIVVAEHMPTRNR